VSSRPGAGQLGNGATRTTQLSPASIRLVLTQVTATAANVVGYLRR
jgi:hypothetical protein